MKIVNDYQYWLSEKGTFIEEMESEESLVYDRLKPFFLTISHLTINESFDEDEAYIFSVGFNYLHEKVFEIESYCTNQFSSFTELEDNSIVYNLLCDLEDFKTDFSDMNNDDRENVQDYVDQVERLLLSRECISDVLYQEVITLMNDITEEHGEYLSVTDIFMQIAENYDLI